MHFAVGELLHVGRGQLAAELIADLFRQHGIGVAREDLEVVKPHFAYRLWSGHKLSITAHMLAQLAPPEPSISSAGSPATPASPGTPEYPIPFNTASARSRSGREPNIAKIAEPLPVILTPGRTEPLDNFRPIVWSWGNWRKTTASKSFALNGLAALAECPLASTRTKAWKLLILLDESLCSQTPARGPGRPARWRHAVPGDDQRSARALARAIHRLRCPGRCPPRCRRSGRKERRCPARPRFAALPADVLPAPEAPAEPRPRWTIRRPVRHPWGSSSCRRKCTRAWILRASSTACAAFTTRLPGMASGSSIEMLGAPGRFVFDVDGIGQRDGLEDRPQFVEAVGALVQHAQIQVDLRQGFDRRPPARHLVEPSNAGAFARRSRAACRGPSAHPAR